MKERAITDSMVFHDPFRQTDLESVFRKKGSDWNEQFILETDELADL